MLVQLYPISFSITQHCKMYLHCLFYPLIFYINLLLHLALGKDVKLAVHSPDRNIKAITGFICIPNGKLDILADGIDMYFCYYC